MHAQPPRTLKRLLKQYGQELIDDPRRTEALLRDLCGQHTREIFVLINAQKQRVPAELLAAPAWMPRQATFSRLSRLLQNKLALTEDAADWAVVAWATALDLEAPQSANPLGWLPGNSGAPTPPTRRKSRRTRTDDGKGQGNSPAKRQAARARAADLGWRWPVWLPTSPSSMLVGRWTEALPWLALGGATIVLLAVVYWIARTPLTPARADPVVVEDAASTPAATIEPHTTPILIARGEAPSGYTAVDYLDRVLDLPTPARISANSVNIRLGPSTADQAVGWLDANEGVHVVGFSQDGNWSQIDQPRSGWVSNDFLLFESQDGAQATILVRVRQASTTRMTDVLAAPRPNAAVNARLAGGLPVTVVAVGVGDAEGWVELAAPAQGWVRSVDLVIPADDVAP